MQNIRKKLLSWFMTAGNDRQKTAEENISLLKNVTAHMLIHAARYDGSTEQEEIQISKDILIKAFNESKEGADALVEKAILEADKYDDWYKHLRQITQTIEYEERTELICHLWMVILADGRIDSHEANFMRRIGSLLGISDKDMNAIRVRLLKTERS